MHRDLSGFCLAVVAASFILAGTTQAAPEPKLKGLVHWQGKDLCLIDLPDERGRQRDVILSPGELTLDYEVHSVKEGKIVNVSHRPSGQEFHLQLDPPNGNPSAPRIFQFCGAKLRSIFDVYQEISGRTVIYVTNQAHSTLVLTSSPGDLTVQQTLGELKAAFDKEGLLTKECGEKFVFIVPQAKEPQVERMLQKLPKAEQSLHKPTQGNLPDNPVFPPGLLKFSGADSAQVLEVYAELTGRSVLRGSQTIRGNVSVRSQTPMTRSEAIWLLDTALCLIGAEMHLAGKQLVLAVAPEHISHLPQFNAQTYAAKARPGHPKVEWAFNGWTPDALLAVYAELVGRKAVPTESHIPTSKASFRTLNPLPPAEAVYALEVLALLHGYTFAWQEKDEVTLERFKPKAQ